MLICLIHGLAAIKLLQLKILKKNLFRTKTLQKQKGKRLQPNKLIQKAINHLNNVKKVKHDSIPEKVEFSLTDPEYRKIYKIFREQKKCKS